LDYFPLVTIGIPNYNYANYIIDSINSVLNQTYPNIELIIVDDFSKDNSVAVIDQFIHTYQGYIKIKFIRNKVNGGLTKVCNQILEAAKGKYFQTLDADDLLLPDKIGKQVKLMEVKEDVAIVYSNVAVIDEKGSVISEDYLYRVGYDKNNMPQDNVFEKLFYFNFIPLPSVLVNTNYARHVGGFDENLQVQDYYLWLKLAEQYNVVFMNEQTALYRVHEASMSNSNKTNPASIASVLDIKFRYFKSVNDTIKKEIKKNIYNSVPYLYEFKFPSAKYWIKQNLLLNPGIKSLGYYVAIKLGIQFSYLNNIKSLLGIFR